jgi:hypothetical protein
MIVNTGIRQKGIIKCATNSDYIATDLRKIKHRFDKYKRRFLAGIQNITVFTVSDIHIYIA